MPVVSSRRLLTLMLAAMALPFAACAKKQASIINPVDLEPVDKPTEGWGLRKLDPKDYPDMRAAWMDKNGLEKAIGKSLQFLNAPSSENYFKVRNVGDTITHDQIVASLRDIQTMMHQNITPDQFQGQILARYDVYTSIGYNNKGDMWFTGYFTPIYHGSRTRTAEYQYPIYSRPGDLHSDELTGQIIGTYPTRRELMATGKLRGQELLWFKKPIEPFLIQVQGSAQVILPNNETVYVGFAGSNGALATGLGTQLREEGILDDRSLSLSAVIAYFDQHPDLLESHVLKDDRMTFQKIYTTDKERAEWPTGSLNVQVTPNRSIATDKNSLPSIFPRASFTYIDVAASGSGQQPPHQMFVLDQDNGGAIRAAGRADIYMGIGPEAGLSAGGEYAQGHLYYIFLKPEFMPKTPAATRPVARTGTPTAPATSARPSGPDDMFPGAVRP